MRSFSTKYGCISSFNLTLGGNQQPRIPPSPHLHPHRRESLPELRHDSATTEVWSGSIFTLPLSSQDIFPSSVRECGMLLDQHVNEAAHPVIVEPAQIAGR